MEAAYQVNPDFTASRVLVGESRTPIIILDNFLQDLTTLKANAQEHVQMSEEQSTYYPGIRAPLPKTYAMAVVGAIYRQLYKVYDIPLNHQMQAVNLVYSLITNTPEQLNANQKRPHFDTSAPFHFAILHYLNEAPHGATGFFRHRKSGLERVGSEHMESYLQLAAEQSENSRQQGYITGSNDEYELIYQVPYQANRVVIYPGNLLHSVLVSAQNDIDDNPDTGRLTANIFIEYV